MKIFLHKGSTLIFKMLDSKLLHYNIVSFFSWPKFTEDCVIDQDICVTILRSEFLTELGDFLWGQFPLA